MASSSVYDVIARFRVDASPATKSLRQLHSGLQRIQQGISGSQSAIGGVLSSVVGIAAGYVGFNAISSAIRAATSDAVAFTSELEATRIGIQSILGAVEGTGFTGAAEAADDAWNRLSVDALKSTATTSELFTIFGAIAGPMRNAGTEMERIYGMTNNTVAAANALGVDLAQAQRDVGAMVRGTAGVDVKLFSMLRSTGAIAKNTEQFNAMTAPERINAIEGALSRFAEASEAYGGSFAGLSSSLLDFYQHFRTSFAGPVFDAMKTIMSSILDVLIVTSDTGSQLSQFTLDLDNRLGLFGERMAAAMLRAFDAIKSALNYVSSHWTEIVEKAQTVARVLKAAFLGAAASSLAKALAGGVFGGLSNIVGLMSTMAEVRAGLGAASIASAAGQAGIGGSVAVEGLGPLGAAVAQVSAAFAPLLPIMLAIGVAVASVGVLFTTNTDEMMGVLAPVTEQFGGLWESIKSIGESVWKILRPVFRFIGAVITVVVVPALSALLSGFRAIALVFEIVIGKIAEFAEWFEREIIDPIVSGFLYAARRIAEMFNWEIPEERNDRRQRELLLPQIDIVGSPDAPGERTRTVNDFRGSRITIEQTFKEADPDRIMVRMMEDLNRAAEQRIQSGYAPALTRS